MITQQQMIEKFMPMIKSWGQKYQKKGEVYARPAEPGEKIDTVTKDGLETTNTAKQGDFVVRNSGGEEYIVDGATMKKRYEQAGAGQSRLGEMGYMLYKAKGTVEGIQYNPQAMEMPAEIQFEAPWGESMALKAGDMVVTPDRKEIYRIAKPEFDQTYKSSPKGLK